MQRTSRLILVPVIAAALALTGCGSSPSSEPQTAAENSSAEAATDPETEAPAELASAVEAGILENFPGGIEPSSPLFAVTQYEDVSGSTVRVYVQENLDKDGRDEVARHIFNLSGLSKDELNTAVVRDASGKDSNHYR